MSYWFKFLQKINEKNVKVKDKKVSDMIIKIGQIKP
jgi:hypothetical protein